MAMISAERTSLPPWYVGITPGATFPWLARLRAATAVLQALALLLVVALPGVDIPIREVVLLLAVALVSNVLMAVWLVRGLTLPRVSAAAALGIEMLLLTALLELTGGPFNPFSVMLIVQVAFAALTLGRLYAGLGTVLAAVCYGALVYWHITEVPHGHHRLNDLPSHVLTMWMSVVAVAELAAYFVVQASNAVARREEKIEAMRQRAARTEHLMSLTTLAAGAAHELSTPLATIAIAARELEHATAARGNVREIAEDARLIRTEVDRCQSILDQMSGRAGGIAADDPETVDITAVLADVRGRLTPEEDRRLIVRLPDRHTAVHLPRAALVRAVASLVDNAFDAAEDPASPVIVEVVHHGDRWSVSVRDQGPAVSADILQRAGEPFFTTKEPGRGLGLGLFLTRIFAERVGGALTLRSGEGTTASLDLPIRSEPAGAA
jgi:two-component system sensor histidine kinase RegB